MTTTTTTTKCDKLCNFLLIKEGDDGQLDSVIIELTAFESHEISRISDALRLNQTVKKVTIYCDYGKNISQQKAGDYLGYLAVAISFLPKVTEICFYSCVLVDLWSICVALTQKSSRFSLEFRQCTLSDGAMAALSYLLRLNKVTKLGFFDYFKFQGNALLQTFAPDPTTNQSLNELILHSPTPSLTMVVVDMLKANQAVQQLSLSVEKDSYFIISDGMAGHQSLNSLTFMRLYHWYDLQYVERIMQTLDSASSIKNVEFNACDIELQAIRYMIEFLSKRQVIDRFQLVSFNTNCHKYFSPDDFQTLGSARVQQLILSQAHFTELAGFERLLQGVATNSTIKVFDLKFFYTSSFEGDWSGALAHFLQQDSTVESLKLSPPFMDAEAAALILEALATNANLRHLTIRHAGQRGLHGQLAFARGLAQIRGLQSLCLTELDKKCEQEFLAEAARSLEQNTTLCLLSLRWVGDTTIAVDKAGQYPMIKYWLDVNRAGRQVLTSNVFVPLGLWSHILANASDSPNGIFYALIQQPDVLIPHRRVATVASGQKRRKR